MKLSEGLLSTLLLIDPAYGGKKQKTKGAQLTGNQKLKKLLRDGFEITDFMYKTQFEYNKERGITQDRCNPKKNKCEPDKLEFTDLEEYKAQSLNKIFEKKIGIFNILL